jgi:hypothetical protein
MNEIVNNESSNSISNSSRSVVEKEIKTPKKRGTDGAGETSVDHLLTKFQKEKEN